MPPKCSSDLVQRVETFTMRVGVVDLVFSFSLTKLFFTHKMTTPAKCASDLDSAGSIYPLAVPYEALRAVGGLVVEFGRLR